MFKQALLFISLLIGFSTHALAVGTAPLYSPSNGASVTNGRPCFDWGSASGARYYMVEVSSDTHFNASSQRWIDAYMTSTNICWGSNFFATGTAGSTPSELPVGTYYWRVKSLGGSNSSLLFRSHDILTFAFTSHRSFTVEGSEPPTVSAAWSQSTINLGESVSLAWSAENVTSCTDDNGVEYVDTNSQFYEDRTSPWSFTPAREGPLSLRLTCLGENGSTVFDTATATVEPAVVVEPYSGFTRDYQTLLGTANGTSIVLTTNTNGTPSIGDIELVWNGGTGTYSPQILSSTSGSWQSVAIDLVLGDFNVDGIVDVLLKNIDPLIPAIPNLVDQIVFAGSTAGVVPLAVTAVDEKFKKFFRDVYNWMQDQTYFDKASNSVELPSRLLNFTQLQTPKSFEAGMSDQNDDLFPIFAVFFHK